MRSLVFILFLFVIFCCTLVYAEECKLPEPKEGMDFTQITGEWFLLVHSNDPIMSEDVGCEKIRNINIRDDGCDVDVMQYNKGEDVRTFTLHMTLMRKGVYQRVGASQRHLPSDYFPDGKLNNAALEEELNELDRPMFLESDNTTLIVAMCSASGERIVWGYTRSPTLTAVTAVDIVNVWNALLDAEFTTKLFLSKCSEFDFSK